MLRTRTPCLAASAPRLIRGPSRYRSGSIWDGRDDGVMVMPLPSQSKGVGNQWVWPLGTLGTQVSALCSACARNEGGGIGRKTKTTSRYRHGKLSSLASLSTQLFNFFNKINRAIFIALGRKLSIWVGSFNFGTEEAGEGISA